MTRVLLVCNRCANCWYVWVYSDGTTWNQMLCPATCTGYGVYRGEEQ